MFFHAVTEVSSGLNL